MNYYEQVVIVEPTLTEEETEAASQKVKDLVMKSGGEILKEDRWGKRKLAYDINKRSDGFYILYNFKAPSSAVKKLEDYYRVYDPVFKYMVIKLEKKQVSALMDELKKPSEEESIEAEPEETSEGE